MAKRPQNVVHPTLREPAEFAEDATSGISSPAKDADPALIAARLLIERALSDAHVSSEQAARDGMVALLLVPTIEWSEVSRQTWQIFLRNGEQGCDGERVYGYERWLAWVPDRKKTSQSLKDSSETLARAIMKGRHCVGIAIDDTWLPPDLVNAADYRLSLPRLVSADVRHIASSLCNGEPSKSITDAAAAALTPNLLRLARRLDQTADAYVAKLSELLERGFASTEQAAPLKTGSPRAEPRLERLHGMDEAVAWGLDVARDLAAFGRGELPWQDVDCGCLLSGPPGTGKTMFARALAATCDVPLVSGSYGEWMGTGRAHQGDLLKAMAGTFDEARSKAPAILFIDEIDSFPDRAAIKHDYVDWETQVVNSLLSQIDGVQGREGVIIIGACNHPQRLDAAIIRSGRLDRHIRIDLPDACALKRILREHLALDLEGVDLTGAALAAAGASGADCERMVRGARRRARVAERSMEIEDLFGEIRGDDKRTTEELWLAAVHEAGHGVAVHELRPGTLEALSLRANGTGGGAAISGGGPAYIRAGDVSSRLVSLLAGRAAEQVIFGEASSAAGGGSDSDLATATYLATLAAASMGLDAEVGLSWLGRPDKSAFPDILAANEHVKARIGLVLEHAHAEAVKLVRRRRMVVEAVASALLEHRALSGSEVAAIVGLNPSQQ